MPKANTIKKSFPKIDPEHELAPPPPTVINKVSIEKKHNFLRLASILSIIAVIFMVILIAINFSIVSTIMLALPLWLGGLLIIYMQTHAR